MLWVQCVIAECLDSVHITHLSQVSIIPNSNLLNLVRSTEAVKEVNKWNLALDCCKVSNRSQIHNLLDVAFCEKCKASLASRHYVRVIAKDVQCMGCNGTCADVENTRELLAGNLVHVWKHEQEALRSGVGSGQSA